MIEGRRRHDDHTLVRMAKALRERRELVGADEAGEAGEEERGDGPSGEDVDPEVGAQEAAWERARVGGIAAAV
jgi:hypothetical protein